MNGLGDILAIARKARGLTQFDLGNSVGLTQVTINRYEAGEREPDAETLTKLAESLRVTPQLLLHGSRFRGALAAEAHMRRRKTTKASVWRQMEARLNLLRVHTSYLFEEISLNAEQRIPTFDPQDTTPQDAARLVRAQWQLPVGPVVNLTRWLEAAGCLVFEEDFGTLRVDGLSQWVGDHPLILLNINAPTDRKRLTLGHELGHLVLHSIEVHEDMEEQANAFAAEFLMPETAIRHELLHISLGKLVDLKREWGISIQALLERAYHLGLVTSTARTGLYKKLNARGWKINEPGSETLPVETPRMPAHIGASLVSRGFDTDYIASIAGYSDPSENPFQPRPTKLRVV